ncbi:putative multicopper like protein [Chaetomidium leptoderma]|uniref:Multicopper like protein n=1 Tax=Chaetomidium leptoderma TaxID=669021 RepID=A0AAN6VPR8_9PEZI|nr:putative multicopper like protein [Chaetomidium leptoderma]
MAHHHGRSTNGFTGLSFTYLICLLWHGLLASAATVTYDFNVTWLTANPDGMADRPTIGINGQWPIPTIRVAVGDRLIVNVLNSLGNESTSLHFHGLFMRGATHMDGPVSVTQCPIPPGERFTYNFTIDQPGTYWYHSHIHGQYPDGIRGPLIVHDPESPFKDMYDEELVMTVSDWYHDQMHGLLTWFMSKANPAGAEPVPNSALLNDTQNLSVPLQPGKTYLFRMVNIGAFAGQYIWFEGHNMTILEVDGVYTHPAEASMIYLATAQRCSFLITARNDSSNNFPIVASMDTDLFDTLPDGLNWNVTGWLVYDDAKPLPEPAVLYEPFEPFDDMGLVPWDNQTILGEPDQTISLDVIMDNLSDGANYAFFNNITYVAPKVPTLYTVLTAGEHATNPAIYGTYTHSFVLERDQIVDIVVNNLDPGKHPFHLHGHHFQVIWRSPDDAGPFSADANLTDLRFPRIPMRRDTVVLHQNGNMVLRFKSDNPGVWLFHCHIEWHVQSGLMATFIEAPLDMQRDITLPADHLAVCEKAGVPTVGNAAGHGGLSSSRSGDWLDLSGERMPPGRLPEGITTRGIVALVFSCVSGILGVAVVAWYGFAGAAVGEEAVSGRDGGQQQQQQVVEGKGGGSGGESDGVMADRGGLSSPGEKRLSS